MLQTVVAVHHATVQIVQVAGGEPTAVQLHHGPQRGRDHGQILEDHPLGAIARLAQRLHNLQALDRLLFALLGPRGADLLTQLLGHLAEIDLGDDVIDRLRAHGGRKDLGPAFAQVTIQRLVQKRARLERHELIALFQRLLADSVAHFFDLERQLREPRLGLSRRGILLLQAPLAAILFELEAILDAAELLFHFSTQLGHVVGGNLVAGVGQNGVGGRENQVVGRLLPAILVEDLFHVGGRAHQRLNEFVASPLDLVLEGLGLFLQRLLILLPLGTERRHLRLQLGGFLGDALFDFVVHTAQRALTGVLVHRCDDILGIVEHAIEVPLRDIQQQPQIAGRAPCVPDVGDGRSQANVPHPLAPNARMGDLDAALVALDATKTDLFVLAAIALPVLGGTKDRLAEQAILLGAQSTIVDRLWFGYLTVGPLENLFGRSQANPNRPNIIDLQIALPWGS